MAIALDTEKIKLSEVRSGFVIGVRVNNDTVVLGICCASVQKDHAEPFDRSVWEEGRQFVHEHYPAGTDIVGWYYKIEKEQLSNSQLNLLYSAMKQYDIVQGSILLTLNSQQCIAVYTLMENNLTPSSLSNEKRVKDFVEKLITFHLQATFELCLPIKPTTSFIRDQLQSLVRKFTMWLPWEQTVLDDNKIDGQVFKCTGLDKEPVKVELLETSVSDWSTVHPLTVTVTPLTTPTIVLPVSLSVVGVVYNEVEQLSRVAGQLREGISHQINRISDVISQQNICSTSVHHYLIPTQLVPVTIVYPHIVLEKGDTPVSDTNLLSMREQLHHRLGLHRDRPYLRKSNRQWLPWKQEPILINPHLSINPVSSGSSRVAMVTGSYAYYHYLQDRFDDKGWGCAYRSLQTIWSWFMYQGYTDRGVPSHREIQEALVECGDKQKSFIGSTQWIGSIEVSNVLNHLLKIDSRIHHCTTGNDLANTGQILLHHFQTQGTPIMIGGGVLAHTILGVNYNSETGNIKFLILDPHYIGPEDIKQIQNKGCGWKTMSFWDHSASYNMCIPLTPAGHI